MSVRSYTRLCKRHLACLDKSSLSRHRVPPQWRLASKVQTAEFALATDAVHDKRRSLKGAVSLTIDGEDYKFPPVLLRDLCSCPLCIDQSTRQKLFATADIPFHISANNCTVGQETATVSWGDDVPGYGREHKSEIPLSALRNIIQFGKPVGHRIMDQNLPRRVFWDAKHWDAKGYWDEKGYMYRDLDFDYDSYMHDDSVLLAALQALHTHGLLFIKSVPGDEKSVETLAERIGPLKSTFYGRTWDVRSVPQAKNVAYTSQNLGFHMDLLYMEQPPHIQLLHCIRSSSAGGASLFTDSFKAVEDLYRSNPEHFETLSKTKAAFHYDHPGSHYYHQFRSVIEPKPRSIGRREVSSYHELESLSAQKMFQPTDFVSAVAWSPPFQAPFALNQDVWPRQRRPSSGAQRFNERLGRNVQQWHEAAHEFNGLIHRGENIYERLMKPGECVIFDNRRILHARKAFEVGDSGKERWLRGAYIDKDPYLSKLRVLMGQNREMESIVGGIEDDSETPIPARNRAPKIHKVMLKD
ncbi:uncharacterized protein RCC_10517 [Ramularia collo-cygni]|uniref:TauD/TfdA-like domain-containing protein n=1 Tax=Ramularia collo-cygni TaxID=112498 RepID=A0A2D3VM07_9PEZI|nr:uncharacterized protein RCC_10517 [Ramularia collo-cygni]CZT24789.1 uncharacterized protein RCC_10517 [Ramularia collo-cygni]